LPVPGPNPYGATLSTAFADLHIPVACVGIDCEGTGYRMDSVPIRMQKVLDSGLPGDEEVLSQILHLVQKRAAVPQCRPPKGATATGT